MLWNNPIEEDNSGYPRPHCWLLQVFQAVWLCSGVFLSNVSPVSVAGIFRGWELELCLCSGVVYGIVEYLQLWDQLFLLFRRLGDYGDQGVSHTPSSPVCSSTQPRFTFGYDIYFSTLSTATRGVIPHYIKYDS